MISKRLLRFLARGRGVRIGRIDLHAISAQELLQAHAQAKEMAEHQPEAEGLYLNACILAKAARKDGRRVFADGAHVMRMLSAEQIAQWAERYLELCASELPPSEDDEREEFLRELSAQPYERLKWRVLRAFGVLPSEARAKQMTDGDYLYCVMQMVLDGREELERLCPACREERLLRRCSCCGEILAEENAAFDEERYEELKRDGLHRGTSAQA